MTQIDLELLVIIRGNWQLARRCLDAVIRRTQPVAVCIRVGLASDDPFLAEELDHLTRRHTARVSLHYFPVKESLPTSFNRILNLGSASFVGFVSTDTILASHCIDELLCALKQRSAAAIASPVLHNGEYRPVRMRPGTCVERMGELLRSDVRPEPIVVGSPEPQCFVVRRDTLAELNGLDLVFEGFTDATNDLALRAAKYGHTCVCVPTSYAYRRGDHDIDADLSSARRNRSSALFKSRWGMTDAKGEASALDLVRATTEQISREQLFPPKRASTERIRIDEPLDILTILPTLSLYGGVISVVNLFNELSLRGNRCTIVSLSPCEKHAHVLYCEPEWVRECEKIPDRFAGHYDVILATSWETVPYAKALAERCAGAHLMYFIQDLEERFHEGGEEREELVIKTYAQIPTRFAKTGYLCDAMKDRGYPTHRIRPGMNLDLFYPRQRGGDPRPSVLGMVRYGHHHRGYDLVLRTLADVHLRMPEARILLFGSDDLSQSEIEFPYENFGRVSPMELPSVYSQADVFLEMSRHHGLGRTGLEAMACGAACVMSDSGGPKEYARDGANSLIVATEDVDAASRAVVRLLTDGAARENLVRAGFSTAARYAERLATDDFLNVVYRTHPGFRAWRLTSNLDDFSSSTVPTASA